MRERFLEFLRRQIDAMRLCKCKPIIFNVVAGGTFDPVDAVNTACNTADHVDPVDILHASTRNRASCFFSERIDAIGDLG